MKILALTGGIASGKSTVGQMFVQRGAILIDADKIAHEVYRKGSVVHGRIVHRYGRSILDRDGQINRMALAKILFSSEREKEWLEGLIHPKTRDLIGKRIDKAVKKNPALILVEAALHIETGYYRLFEGLIIVKISPKVQLERLVERAGLKPAEAKLRIKRQGNWDKRYRMADWLIDNSGSFQKTEQQVDKLYQRLTRAAPRKKKGG